MLRFGQFDIDFNVGVTLVNRDQGRTLYFQPGDEAGQFCDELEALDLANPDTDYAIHLAGLWHRYSDAAE